jgi:L-asparaginase II
VFQKRSFLEHFVFWGWMAAMNCALLPTKQIEQPPLFVKINKNTGLYATFNGKHTGFLALCQKRTFLTQLQLRVSLDTRGLQPFCFDN